MKIHIKNGRLIDPANNIDAKKDVLISAGKISAITAPGKLPYGFKSQRTIDAENMIVSPGFVDLSARLREPGYEHKATLESELQAAMQGGVTSLVCPPDTDPVLDEPGLVEMLKYRARNLNRANVYPLGALTMGLKGNSLTEMAELSEAGCIGFSQANTPISDTSVLLRALQYAKTFNLSVWLQPQDPHLGKTGMAHSGLVASRLGLSGIPVVTETIALHTIFELVRSTGARVHLCRISSAAGLDLTRKAKKEKLPITCDVGVHYLHMSEENINFFDTNARVLPPFRAKKDKEALCEAVLDGTVDAICSDHTPVDADEKLLPFGEATPGTTGLELLLPLTLKWAKDSPTKSSEFISKAIEKITIRPAKIAGINAGTLSVGSNADLCIFDPNKEWKVEAGVLASQGKHTPFLNETLKGKVRITIVGGRITYKTKV